MATFQEQTGSNNPFNGVDVGSGSRPTFADIDSDGDLDAFIGEWYGTIRYYRNDGGTFSNQIGTNNPLNVVSLVAYTDPALVDIDGDGDLDAFIGESNGTIYYYRNDGGTFNQQTDTNNPFNGVDVGSCSRPAFADIDTDGDLDAFIGLDDDTVRYYRNDGGTFNEQTGTNNPLNVVVNLEPYSNSTIALADIDGDGDSDAFIGNQAGTIRYYRNDGGIFSEQTGTNNPLNSVDVPYQSSPTFADIDGDGDSDAFIGNQAGTIRYYENASVVTIATGTSATEAGTTGTFTLTLSEPAPAAGLTVSYTVAGTASNGTDYDALPGTVTFAAGETVATINIVPINDTVADPNETVQLTLTDAASYNLAGSPNNTATLTIEDNDIEYAIAAGTPTVAEGNTGNTTPITFTITRTGGIDQASSVNFDLAGTATNNIDYSNLQVAGTGITLTGNTVNFAAGATTATISVDVAGDVVTEGNESLQVSLSSPTAPAGFEAAVPVATPATTTITDDDVAGFTITPAGVTLNTNEAGGRATFTIALNTQPTADVSIALSSSNTAEGVVSLASVTFNATNWNTPQTVTLTGQDDLNADGEVSYQIITAGAVSADANYSGLDAPDINVTNTDNDSPGITITQSDGITSVAEGGVTDSYQIALNTVPTGSVEITLTADTQTEISLDGNTFSSTLSFTRSDLSAQTITVRAIDDSIVSEGTHAGKISHAITNSPDSNYPTTLGINSVNVSITDNDNPPTVVNINKGGTEDTAITLAAADFLGAFTDPDSNSLTKVQITSLPANGTLTLNGVAVTANQEINLASLSNLTFTPAANFNGSTSFNWNGFDGITYAAAGATVNLAISAANDAPTVTNIVKAANEDTIISFTSADFTGAFSDVEGNSLAKIQISTLPANGTLTLNGAAVTANQEIATTQLGGLTFTPNANFKGSTSLNWNGFDGTGYAIAGASVNLTVNSINDLPALGNISKSANEDTAVSFTAADFTTAFSDADGDSLTKIQITTLPANGNLTLNGAAVALNQEIAATQLDGLTFTPNANFNGSTSFNWNGFDGTSYSANDSQINLTVNPKNDLPIVSTVSKTGSADTAIAFTSADFQSAFGDLDNDPLSKIKITSLPGNGSLTLNGVGVKANQEINIAALGNLAFTPDADFSGLITFGWNGFDGIAYAVAGATVSLAVDVINTAPTLGNISKAGNQNADITFTTADFTSQFTDADGNALTKVKITSLPNNGTLRLSGVSVTANQEIDTAVLGNLTFTPNAGFSGVITFGWNGFDGIAYAAAGAAVSLTVNTRGWVIDNYISGATVFLDANRNGVVDSTEASVITDSKGEFNLDIPFDIFDKNSNGEIDPEEGRLGAFGGTDTATGLPLETPLTAPASATVITLLTTVIQDLIEQGIEPDEANAQVLTALSLPSDIDLTDFDPILATNNNQAGGVEVLAAMTQVQNVITQTNALIDGASTAENSAIMKAVVAAFTTQIKAGTTLDLSSAEQLATLLQQAVTNIKQIDANLNPIIDTQFIAAVAGVMAQSNQAIDKAVTSSTGESVDEEIARVQKVTLDEVVKDLREAGAGTKQISEVIAEDTGVALDAQIQGIVIDDDDTIPGVITPEIPVITGTVDLVNPSLDQMFGTDGDDTLTGTSGDDAISARQGNDSIVGNDGNDLLFGNQGDDFIDGSAGNDTLYGGKDNDTLLGNGGEDQLFGNLGNDSLNAGDGDDYLNGNQGNDILDGGAGNDSIHGGKDSDILSGNTGNDIVCGDMGSDNLAGNEGNDLLFGNADSDNLDGGAGADSLHGGKDNDSVSGGDDDDALCGDLGDDSLNGDAGNDALYGNAGGDLLEGGDGNDTLHGGKDDDTLTGGSGDDILSGDLGNDSLIGGAGSDGFVLKFGAGSDTITDFTDGEDLLGLAAGLTFESLTITSSSNATLISVGDELLASLTGVQADLITVNDFAQV
ncbi:MAG: tandem-95 repeat protein [Microcoleus vaginatus WJT46-NPBG5]|jgi:Ca2+-binding RTX toxin-like protein|nr:tandem-95 repeat protein [Microcoleus vaginatus WJT46-NPBG5]